MSAIARSVVTVLSNTHRCARVGTARNMLDLPASRVAHPCRRNPRVSTVRLGMIRSSTRMNFQHARASASSTVENKVTKVFIVIYTTYGHTYQMATKVKEGVNAVDGCEAVLYQVQETLPPEVLEKMGAPPKPDLPIIAANDLLDADGILFGAPTRFGMIPAQVKSFLDTTGGLWAQGSLVGKPAGIFFSTATQGAGQETTALTFVTQLAHHGMIFVPTGYISPAQQSRLDVVVGGSAYGAGTFAGSDGSRQPSEDELIRAYDQGKSFAAIAKKLSEGGKEGNTSAYGVDTTYLLVSEMGRAETLESNATRRASAMEAAKRILNPTKWSPPASPRSSEESLEDATEWARKGQEMKAMHTPKGPHEEAAAQEKAIRKKKKFQQYLKEMLYVAATQD